MEFSKEMFLLEDIVRPYVLYLQKIASLFDFYASLRRGGLKPLAPPEVWILMNLVRCVTALTNQLPAVCRFIRKSYRPIADALGESLSRDLGYFYPKLFKFCHS